VTAEEISRLIHADELALVMLRRSTLAGSARNDKARPEGIPAGLLWSDVRTHALDIHSDARRCRARSTRSIRSVVLARAEREAGQVPQSFGITA